MDFFYKPVSACKIVCCIVCLYVLVLVEMCVYKNIIYYYKYYFYPLSHSHYQYFHQFCNIKMFRAQRLVDGNILGGKDWQKECVCLCRWWVDVLVCPSPAVSGVFLCVWAYHARTRTCVYLTVFVKQGSDARSPYISPMQQTGLGFCCWYTVCSHYGAGPGAGPGLTHTDTQTHAHMDIHPV